MKSAKQFHPYQSENNAEQGGQFRIYWLKFQQVSVDDGILCKAIESYDQKQNGKYLKNIFHMLF